MSGNIVQVEGPPPSPGASSAPHVALAHDDDDSEVTSALVRPDTNDDDPTRKAERDTVTNEITTAEQEQAKNDPDEISNKIEASDLTTKGHKGDGSRRSTKRGSARKNSNVAVGPPRLRSRASRFAGLLRLHDRVKELENRASKGKNRKRRGSASSSGSGSGSSSSSGSRSSSLDRGSEDGDTFDNRRPIAEVKECDWEQFKNRFGPQDVYYAVEYFISGEKWRDEVAHEERRRDLAAQRARYKVFDEKIDSGPSRRKMRLDKDWGEMMQNNDAKKDTEKRWIQRIRVNSVPVLKRLGRVAGETWTGSPRTFFRPFRKLIHYHDKMKEELQTLESILAAKSKPLDLLAKEQETPDRANNGAANDVSIAVENTTNSDDPTTPENTAAASPGVEKAVEPQKDDINRTNTQLSEVVDDPPHSETQRLEQEMNSKEALQDLKCFVRFVDEKIMPLYHQFDNPENVNSHKIRFDDLWYLFRVGDPIYVPNTTKHDTQANSDAKQPSVDQRIWRLFSQYPPSIRHKITGAREIRRPPPPPPGVPPGAPNPPLPPPVRNDIPRLWCYYIDYDGGRYCPVIREFSIAYFTGEKSIQELEIYPLRFAPDSEEIIQEYQTLGQNFVQYLTQRPLAYNNWTLIADPRGGPINNSNGDPIKHPEYIDSDMIVDFKEAFQTYPPWRPPIQFNTMAPRRISAVEPEQFHMIRWSDSNCMESLSKLIEFVLEDDDIDYIQRNANLEKDPYLRRGAAKIFNDEDYLLLPRRLFAYALRERRFVHVDVQFLKPIAEHLDGFQSLKVDPGHKKMIQSLVSFHFKKKDVEKKGAEIGSQDFIRGKGRGVVILLHGVPGVGKTATAEAVAQANKKPLFPITCGDLGFTPESVETSLSEIFRLAHLWDCVLLLDEADIFLSQRTKDDLQRNALVSVFLRILEYFNGILFLTTNRPGTLDEAVKSRVHMSLYYSSLGELETEEIFRLNLSRLKEIEEQRANVSGEEKLFIFDAEIIEFAKQHYRKHVSGPGRWNGRQIRNAFQIASSLAHYDGDAHPGAQKQLRAKHFEIVDEATTMYDQYRAEISGKQEGELAHEREERFDEFRNAERERGKQASFYGEEKRYQSGSYGGEHGYPQPSSQFQAPGPMTGYSQGAPAQTQGPPPQNMSGMQYSSQTPPSQRIGLPIPHSGAQQQQSSGYPIPGYGTSGGQLHPMQQQVLPTPQEHHQQPPNAYGQAASGPPLDPRYGTPNQGYPEYGSGPSSSGTGQTQAASPFAGRGPYDPLRDVFAPGP
ncbi:uncharacterized protein LY89DRAFT_721075 [Mollisia scopiformis]|uniref:AAA+ ATPase domain-containing protein n=1 Tax=Mollisia scopiformis TaxID=149040 RepID=A0A194X122_MOLSC|nr:uncharacterized protein LY89DRAFT_721075 [Mollisia scopiformis]KUJ13891.1 hypothetical protein LY89DRAFT_721075 [Mollisia scopiformis]